MRRFRLWVIGLATLPGFLLTPVFGQRVGEVQGLRIPVYDYSCEQRLGYPSSLCYRYLRLPEGAKVEQDPLGISDGILWPATLAAAPGTNPSVEQRLVWNDPVIGQSCASQDPGDIWMTATSLRICTTQPDGLSRVWAGVPLFSSSQASVGSSIEVMPGSGLEITERSGFATRLGVDQFYVVHIGGTGAQNEPQDRQACFNGAGVWLGRTALFVCSPPDPPRPDNSGWVWRRVNWAAP